MGRHLYLKVLVSCLLVFSWAGEPAALMSLAWEALVSPAGDDANGPDDLDGDSEILGALPVATRRPASRKKSPVPGESVSLTLAPSHPVPPLCSRTPGQPLPPPGAHGHRGAARLPLRC